jgi:hypothetical protein
LKNIILILLFFILPAAAFAEAPAEERPHWSLEVKGGTFTPDIADWATYYGERATGQFEASLAYKILRQVEAGVAIGRIRDGGQGWAPIHSAATGTTTYGGHIKYQLFPVSVFVVLRGVFTKNQWVVPYVGGGWTRMYYQEELSLQPTVRGYADGSLVRGGLQFLLDALDERAATNMLREYGIYHTYFFMEGQRTRAMINSVAGESINLGGTSVLGGLLFEF